MDNWESMTNEELDAHIAANVISVDPIAHSSPTLQDSKGSDTKTNFSSNQNTLQTPMQSPTTQSVQSPNQPVRILLRKNPSNPPSTSIQQSNNQTSESETAAARLNASLEQKQKQYEEARKSIFQ